MNIWPLFKSLAGGVGIYAALYICAWVSNAIYATKFDLPQLLELVKWMVANHCINSGLNSSIPLIDQLKKGGNQ